MCTVLRKNTSGADEGRWQWLKRRSKWLKERRRWYCWWSGKLMLQWWPLVGVRLKFFQKNPFKFLLAGNANTAKKLRNPPKQLKRAGTPRYLEQYDSALFRYRLRYHNEIFQQYEPVQYVTIFGNKCIDRTTIGPGQWPS